MNFKNFRFRNFITNMIVVLLYPIYRYVSNSNSVLAFSDACTLVSLILIIIGLVLFLHMHGDFDITKYIATRSFGQNKEEFAEFKAKENEKREDSFNYPLLCGLILFVIAYLSALAV